MSWWRRAGLLPVLAASSALLSASPTAASTALPPPHVWLVADQPLGQLLQSPGAAGRLRAARTYDLLAPGAPSRAGVGSPTAVFTSAAALAASVAAGRLPAQVRTVLYDPERWAFTPRAEQVAPFAAVRQAAAAAHAHGLQLIVSPALDLMGVAGPGGGPYWRGYLAAGLAAGVALAGADVVEVQAQSLEANPAAYAALVTAAAAQARAARPGVLVLAGLSTGPTGVRVVPRTLPDAVRAVSGVVDGFWLNVPGPGAKCPRCSAPSIALALTAFQP
ncbi:MAG TPA: hypothetical protein VGN54_00105 [Mycobacteriales bacterium]|nr:hypothetical protein [Mycobacteriales bacterium]